MRKLNELYDGYPDIDIKGIKINSKEVEPGDIFVCTMGVTVDRHDYIDEAIANGASFLVVKKDGNYKVPFIKVNDPNAELSRLSKKFYENPDEKLKLIGITGTDGKTTTAMIIRDLLGYDTCGYIGTNGIKGKKVDDVVTNTTPDCHVLYKILDSFVKEDLKYVSMETSSEAFFRNRLSSFQFEVGILTNITGDHLNIHKTFENYLDSKKQLFRQIKSDGYAILNMDDKYYEEFASIHHKVLTYGKNENANLYIKSFIEHSDNTEIVFRYQNCDYNVTSPLVGEFNVYNLASAILGLIALGLAITDIIDRIKNIKVPSGRCEILDFKTPYKIVLDYAHTVNGLSSILEYLNKIKKTRIITVVGSAGGREKEKRSKMGKVVLEKSDLVIFTTDDPRYENPKDIINEMIGDNQGNYIIIIDRKIAIEHALKLANPDDIILVAGKGRDNYMAIEDKHIPYCDYDVIKNYFDKKNK